MVDAHAPSTVQHVPTAGQILGPQVVPKNISIPPVQPANALKLHAPVDVLQQAPMQFVGVHAAAIVK
jgi:hypothetical protein